MNFCINATAAAALLAAGVAHAQALGLQDLPDDVRATVKKELARKSGAATAANDDPALADMPSDRRSKGCSMSLAATETPSRGRRDVVFVATRPIVQVCK